MPEEHEFSPHGQETTPAAVSRPSPLALVGSWMKRHFVSLSILGPMALIAALYPSLQRFSSIREPVLDFISLLGSFVSVGAFLYALRIASQQDKQMNKIENISSDTKELVADLNRHRDVGERVNLFFAFDKVAQKPSEGPWRIHRRSIPSREGPFTPIWEDFLSNKIFKYFSDAQRDVEYREYSFPGFGVKEIHKGSCSDSTYFISYSTIVNPIHPELECPAGVDSNEVSRTLWYTKSAKHIAGISQADEEQYSPEERKPAFIISQGLIARFVNPRDGNGPRIMIIMEGLQRQGFYVICKFLENLLEGTGKLDPRLDFIFDDSIARDFVCIVSAETSDDLPVTKCENPAIDFIRYRDPESLQWCEP